jgi:hypothetical protein
MPELIRIKWFDAGDHGIATTYIEIHDDRVAHLTEPPPPNAARWDFDGSHGFPDEVQLKIRDVDGKLLDGLTGPR